MSGDATLGACFSAKEAIEKLRAAWKSERSTRDVVTAFIWKEIGQRIEEAMNRVEDVEDIIRQKLLKR